jgi:hypothetical protein
MTAVYNRPSDPPFGRPAELGEAVKVLYNKQKV